MIIIPKKSAALLALGFFLASPPALHAHGPEKHSAAGEAHLRAMQRLKEGIPEDFRIMDRTPVTPSGESLRRGKAAYQKFCQSCHGERGDGKGPAAQGMDPAPADFLDLKHSGIYGPGEKFWIIGNGIQEAGMPGFTGQIDPRGRWDLVNYILELQKSVKIRKSSDHQHHSGGK